MTVPHGVGFRRSPRALWRRIDTGVVVTTLEHDDVHELTGGAGAVWADLDVPRMLPELVGRLAAAHGEVPEAIASQVEGCIEALLSLGVVEEVQSLDA